MPNPQRRRLTEARSGVGEEENEQAIVARSLRQRVDFIVTQVHGLNAAGTGKGNADGWVAGKSTVTQCKTEQQRENAVCLTDRRG
jgi:hypothetical protein